MALMNYVASVGSFQRVQDFLEKDSHSDPRNRSSELPMLVPEDKKIVSVITDAETLTNGSTSSKSWKGSSSTSFHNAVTLQGGDFGWDTAKKPILKNLNITISHGSFVTVIGPSGCGKSTLLKAILGEVPCLGGSIQVLPQSIAFCEQTPWHTNGTIEDCIVAMAGYDARWYSSVIYACALAEDFKQLPRGDKTVIGSKGIALSGGQSQRIVSMHVSMLGSTVTELAYRHLQGLSTLAKTSLYLTMCSVVLMRQLRIISFITCLVPMVFYAQLAPLSYLHPLQVCQF